MSLTIDLPEEQERTLRAAFGAQLGDAAREALAIEGYRRAKLSVGDVQDLLGLSTRHEVEQLLASRGVRMNYSAADLQEDRRTLSELLGIPL